MSSQGTGRFERAAPAAVLALGCPILAPAAAGWPLAVREDLAGVVQAALEPAHIAVWTSRPE